MSCCQVISSPNNWKTRKRALSVDWFVVRASIERLPAEVFVLVKTAREAKPR